MIEFRGVGHAYEDRVVLADIDLTLGERRIGIIGANGSGKSTLARMINALVVPDRGSVTVNGIDAARHKRRVRKEVGFIFSDPDRQIIMPTVIEDIELSLTRTMRDRAERTARAAAVLAQFGLADHADHPAHRLSGGQKQLLALASVMVTGPSVLVADEPTTLLDLRNSSMLRSVFATLDEQLVVLTHDLDMVADYDRVIVLDEGRVVADDEPAAAVAAYRRLMA
ncbi:ATP-binding cassette domain-containing protein [Gordonia sp. HNM0687]|uniref:ATP-binding cassette domain-containing protein n=1 Tax=Gordonia mangrovi TaxID=2665643 RepID=A0A6L7GUA5_9ACTN|nr:ABC transporter ATP-binding protein [Gordonia mangrovi]MDY6807683.1 ABC transporter ATP-binding protein [Actinomycetota bacterium]MXP23047.1 ATP-binding cassette domain-containing protein [Gordonia mangrovi]UVF77337.1 energy-coupling factor ABC transporter ATP-binding protein [Gordonia mangrovi]